MTVAISNLGPPYDPMQDIPPTDVFTQLLTPSPSWLATTMSAARAWLTVAGTWIDPRPAVSFRDRAETVRKQCQPLVQAQATELVRRAERAIALAIRAGQAAGRIETAQETVQRAARDARANREGLEPGPRKHAPFDFVAHSQLAGTGSTRGYYQLADGISDSRFEMALLRARADGNLSRAHLVRVLHAPEQPDVPLRPEQLSVKQKTDRIAELAPTGMNAAHIAEQLGIGVDHTRRLAKAGGITIVADKVMGRTRRIDSTKVLAETVAVLDGLQPGLRLIDFDDVDLTDVADWSASLADSLRALNRLAKKIKELSTA